MKHITELLRGAICDKKIKIDSQFDKWSKKGFNILLKISNTLNQANKVGKYKKR